MVRREDQRRKAGDRTSDLVGISVVPDKIPNDSALHQETQPAEPRGLFAHRAHPMDQSLFSSLCDYVGFDDSSGALLRAFLPRAKPHFPQLADDFYQAIASHPNASAAIAGGPPQVERLKQTLMRWLQDVLTGPYDDEYLARHARIGRAHVRIKLPQEYMFTATNRLRNGLLDLARDLDEAAGPTAKAINQILDLELGLMLETYREDWLASTRTNERLATIGQFAATVGHELRNPLGIMESSLFLLGKRLAQLDVCDEVVERHQTRIFEQVKSCSDAISTLLDLTRDAPPHRQELHLEEILERALSSLPLPGHITVVRDIPAGLRIYADPGQLKQLLTNLLSNAFHALDSAQTERPKITIGANTMAGGTEIWVSDDGPGIERQLTHRVFDALFTTRPDGTGLGLALCQKIVQAHQGDLRVVPSDQGATLRVWLPDARHSST